MAAASLIMPECRTQKGFASRQVDAHVDDDGQAQWSHTTLIKSAEASSGIRPQW
jgi:hypothetical protein